MKVINLFGGPGVGKSTTAAGLFYEMKKARLNVELVTEYAKELVWDKRDNTLSDQLYVFAVQQRRLRRLVDSGLEWVITDSPLPLSAVYDDGLYAKLQPLVREAFEWYDNYNFLVQRNTVYNPVGRNQKDVMEAVKFDNKVTAILRAWKVPFVLVKGGEDAVREIGESLGWLPKRVGSAWIPH